MNSVVRLLVAGTCLAAVVACGRPPAPDPPHGYGAPPTEQESVATSTTDDVSSPTSADERSGGAPSARAPGTAGHVPTAAQPTRQPPPKKRPPRPKPPARWVLSPLDRPRIEERKGVPFDQVATDGFWQSVCPNGDVCVGTAFDYKPSLGHEDEDCWVGDIIVPDPLHERDTVTWVVNNPCGEDPPEAPAGP